jgi:protein-S-isoprenylcysteine O-methyltransferase Ste14
MVGFFANFFANAMALDKAVLTANFGR